MADLDFDELDKQVNALMGKVNSGYATEPDEDAVKNLDIKPTLKDDEHPEFKKVSAAAEKIGGMSFDAPDETERSLTIVNDEEDLDHSEGESRVALDEGKPDDKSADREEEMSARVDGVPERKGASAAQRPSSGRFLDMVNPKSDMRNVAVPDRPDDVIDASRSPKIDNLPRGKLIQPVISDIKKPESSKHKMSREAKPLQPRIINESLREDDDKQDNQSLVTSPFLSDAKVEKRPLGGDVNGAKRDFALDFKSKEAKNDGAETSSYSGLDGLGSPRHDIDEQRMLDPSNFAVNTPEEEHASELLAIEKIEVRAPEISKPPKSLQEVESADTGVKEHVKAYTEMTTDTASGVEYDINKVDPRDREKILGARKKPTGISMTSVLIVLGTVVVISAALAFLFLFRQ